MPLRVMKLVNALQFIQVSVHCVSSCL